MPYSHLKEVSLQKRILYLYKFLELHLKKAQLHIHTWQSADFGIQCGVLVMSILEDYIKVYQPWNMKNNPVLNFHLSSVIADPVCLNLHLYEETKKAEENRNLWKHKHDSFQGINSLFPFAPHISLFSYCV